MVDTDLQAANGGIRQDCIRLGSSAAFVIGEPENSSIDLKAFKVLNFLELEI